jgi:prepilin peptidase CpaA
MAGPFARGIALPTIIISLALALLLAIAACQDVINRTIPDTIVITLAIIGIVARATIGWAPLFLSVATALLIFAILLVFAIRGWLGGGDVKLAAALAVALPPTAAWDFIVATTITGGLLGCGYVAGLRFAPRLRPVSTSHTLTRILAIEAWRLRRGGPLPYGVAIAAGGVFVLLSTPR